MPILKHVFNNTKHIRTIPEADSAKIANVQTEISTTTIETQHITQ